MTSTYEIQNVVIGPVAGRFPIWVGTKGQIAWSKLGSSVLNPRGRIDKDIWIVDKSVQGDLLITSRQLDGGQAAWFQTKDVTLHARRIDNTTITFDDVTLPEQLMIPSAQEGRHASPKGLQYHGVGVIYPRPGCYEYTATLSSYTVNIVVEVLDE